MSTYEHMNKGHTKLAAALSHHCWQNPVPYQSIQLHLERFHFYREPVLVQLSKDGDLVTSILCPLLNLISQHTPHPWPFQLTITMFATPTVISFSVLILITITGSVYIWHIYKISIVRINLLKFYKIKEQEYHSPLYHPLHPEPGTHYCSNT